MLSLLMSLLLTPFLLLETSTAEARDPARSHPPSVVSQELREEVLGAGRIEREPGRVQLSPFPAIIEGVHVQPGQDVRKGQRLLTLGRIDPSRDYVQFVVKARSSGNLSKLKVFEGQEVQAYTELVEIVPTQARKWGTVLVPATYRSTVREGDRMRVRKLGSPAQKRSQPGENGDPETTEVMIWEVSDEHLSTAGLYSVRFRLAESSSLQAGQMIELLGRAPSRQPQDQEATGGDQP